MISRVSNKRASYRLCEPTVRRCALCKTLAMLGWGLSLAISADTWAESAGELAISQAPLAECAVQTLSRKPASAEMPSNPLLAIYQPTVEDPLSNYARTEEGQWQIPAQVDRTDPRIRLLVFSPARPVIIDLAVSIGGKPFRAAREELIDRLLEETEKESLKRNRAKASSPDPNAVPDLKTETEEEPTPDESATASSVTSDAATPADAPPMVKARARQARTVARRLINYLAAADVAADREEIRWLLAEWTGGPALLTLGQAASWQRADSAPLWVCLDSNSDGALSAEEIRQTMARLQQADVDQDDVLDLEELGRMGAASSPTIPFAGANKLGHPLVVVLDEQTDWGTTEKHLRTAYPASAARMHADLAGLLAAEADIVCRVNLGGKDLGGKGDRYSLLSVTGTGEEPLDFIPATGDVITVELGGAYVEFSAAQGASANGVAQLTQVAIGAVVDGYPLFRLVDQDNNRRLTLRERRQIQPLLATLDRNSDGQLDQSEIPTAIRLALTHGPHLHEHLSTPTSAARDAGHSDRSAAPSWFVDMDRNHDGDLSREEFLGTSSQFEQFDQDRDGLLSSQETERTADAD